MRSPTEMTELFRARGLKVTPQRECIFGVLHGSEVHPTAESVYAEARRRMPTMSLKTVYQTLNDLAEMGELQLLDLGTGAGRFDPNVDPHHHLVCTSCGKVRDLRADFAALRVPEAELQGFAVGAADVVFRGVCADCRAERRDAGPAATTTTTGPAAVPASPAS
ncbi:MAG TPA: Fur family transcriptional regulator [Acidimicrobiales bacterium]|nr:Fur family transcriptional regulator [Acidimicrobiales bacterium]